MRDNATATCSKIYACYITHVILKVLMDHNAGFNGSSVNNTALVLIVLVCTLPMVQNEHWIATLNFICCRIKMPYEFMGCDQGCFCLWAVIEAVVEAVSVYRLIKAVSVYRLCIWSRLFLCYLTSATMRSRCWKKLWSTRCPGSVSKHHRLYEEGS